MLEKYFHDLQCDYWREYPHAYGLLNVYNKTIQIVGADCGSSALYFLLRGAKYIIQYEKKQHLREKWKEVCTHFDICQKAEMRSEWNGQYDNADIFIMDCEGCEENLDVSQLKRYEQYCIAVHDWTKNRVDLMRKLEGLTFTYISDDGREIVLCKVR
ncbi:putative methyltransferase [Metallosphaera rod-shaped virus 1]|uniref:Putative methyltransferase n=1 Tax=Metallosphaera rod-shaped virus 1 TaxID=2730618 RepID=A0A6M3VYW2_9VIRU|nr:putative methyltransferase [Metallosphaera rod-shaped virus 1]QJF12370.1 putative methyltransferase [Metallosphaera rod-shaped virus 1]